MWRKRRMSPNVESSYCQHWRSPTPSHHTKHNSTLHYLWNDTEIMHRLFERIIDCYYIQMQPTFTIQYHVFFHSPHTFIGNAWNQSEEKNIWNASQQHVFLQLGLKSLRKLFWRQLEKQFCFLAFLTDHFPPCIAPQLSPQNPHCIVQHRISPFLWTVFLRL